MVHVEELLRRAVRHVQAADDPPGLPVDRHQSARLRVEHQDAHGAGPDALPEVSYGRGQEPPWRRGCKSPLI